MQFDRCRQKARYMLSGLAVAAALVANSAHASSLADALVARSIVEAEPDIDLVLSDVVLPKGISGPDLARELRTKYPDLKFVFMSGYPAVAAKTNGFIGSDRVLLNKPFETEALAAAIRDALSD